MTLRVSSSFSDKQLDAEIAEAAGEERGHDFGRALRHGVEERVAAADVGVQDVFHADAVAELHGVNVARAAAVVSCSCRARGRRRTRSAPCGTSACADG